MRARFLLQSINEMIWQVKQLKNQQYGKNCAVCALHISIPAKKLITVRTIIFGKGWQEDWKVKVRPLLYDPFDDCSTSLSISGWNIL